MLPNSNEIFCRNELILHLAHVRVHVQFDLQAGLSRVPRDRVLKRSRHIPNCTRRRCAHGPVDGGETRHPMTGLKKKNKK